MDATSVKIAIEGDATVSGLWLKPAKAKAAYVFAHGAGAGMTHKSMTAIAEGLAAREIASLRFNFPYMEKGSGRPDLPPVAHAAIRAAVNEVRTLAKKLPLFAGGKSFGGRMTSQAQALEPLDGMRGLIFFGFPLHPAGKPSVERAKHLKDIKVPMLFLQGTKDALADLTLLRKTVRGLDGATLEVFADADHSFHVPAKTGRKDPEVLAEILDRARDWISRK